MVRVSIAKNGIFRFAKIECLKKVFSLNCHSPLIISSCATAHTHKTDKIERPELYRQNRIDQEEKLENMV